VNDKKTNIESVWVKKICEGDAQSFESLFKAYCQNLIYFARRYVFDKQTAENIVQDIFVRIWTNRQNLDSTKSIKTYLFTAVKNESLKYLRRADVENRNNQIEVDRIEDTENAYDRVEQKEIYEDLNEAVNSLPEKCAEIFRMSKFDKLKYSEIADVLNISVKTVETQMGRALEKLRKNLKHLIILFLTITFLLSKI
jgi:RNA polymerase sigma-19 factor, ECF subfamily